MPSVVGLQRRIAHFLRPSWPRIAAFFEFPPPARPRYGWGRPEYLLFSQACDAKRKEIQALLASFLQYRESLARIPRRLPADAASPVWENVMFPPLDAIALYCMLSLRRPRRYIEVGAGYSTRFARRAIADNALPTIITCIDPAPGIEVKSVADEAISSPLEDVNLSLFERLEAGDFLFIDGSHRVFMNSDTTVVFLEILPMLKPGVIVHFHDIHLPHDYPPDWAPLYYNEQYMLAAYLLGGRLEITLPNAFITRDPELHRVLDPIWTSPAMAGLPTYGGSFWGSIPQERQTESPREPQ